MNIIASIPVKPHLKQFALLLENKGHNDVLNLKTGGIICYVLRMMLVGKMKMPDRSDYRLNAEYCDQLQFKIDTRMLERGQFSLSTQNIAAFNQFLHLLLNELLLDRVLYAREKYLKKEIDVIYEFLNDFQIDDDLESDTLKKSNYRLRKSKKMPVFTDQSVLPG